MSSPTFVLPFIDDFDGIGKTKVREKKRGSKRVKTNAAKLPANKSKKKKTLGKSLLFVSIVMCTSA